MKTEKSYVTIQSQITIRVTPGLQNNDVTNPDAHVADRLKINPTWPTTMVIINSGVHVYPAEIVEWPTVKALVKDKILTIGEYLDTTDEAQAVEDKQKIKTMAEQEVKANVKVENNKAVKLADIAGDEE